MVIFSTVVVGNYVDGSVGLMCNLLNIMYLLMFACFFCEWCRMWAMSNHMGSITWGQFSHSNTGITWGQFSHSNIFFALRVKHESVWAVCVEK
jgi:hypothetical protein